MRTTLAGFDPDRVPGTVNTTQQHYILLVCRHTRIVGLYGFILFLPCSIAFTQICLTLLTLAYIVETALTKQFRFPRLPINRYLLGYLAVTLIAILFSARIFYSLKASKDLLVIVLLYLFYVYIKNVLQLKRFTALLVIFVTITAFYGIIQHYLEVDLFRLNKPIGFLKHVNDDLKAPVRISGFFSTYMTFSGQLAMIIPIIWALLFSVKSVYKKALLGVSLILTAWALLWTYTRSAWLATACALGLFGCIRGKKLSFFVVLVLIFIVVIIIFQPAILDRSLSVFSTKENTERIYTWLSTLEMIKDHPLIGIGRGNYSRIAPAYREKYDFKFSTRAHAHNNILQIAVETGIPSALFFLWLWGIMFRELYRTYQQIPERQGTLKALSLGFLGALTAFFIQGFFEHNFGDAESVMMMWFITALALKLQSLLCKCPP